MRRLTDAIFKERLFEKYGDSIKATEMYGGMYFKIGFECNAGHAFPSTPHGMLNEKVKTGCPKCGRSSARISLTNTLEEIMTQVRSKHGDTFQLIGEYSGRKLKTTWKCSNGHVLFSSLENIMTGHGCKRCAGKVNNHEEYLDELKVRFGGKVWPLERYRASRIPIWHECVNGHKFLQCPNQVLNSELGCCSSCSGNKKRSNEAYDKELAEIHEGRVIRIGDYVHSNALLEHECGLCSRRWMATRGSVVHQESGCRECAVYGFKMTEPAFLYYLRIIDKATGIHSFKIGITNRDVEFRVGQMAKAGVAIETIMIQPFVFGEDAYNTEQRILDDFSSNLVQGCTLLKNGNSEVFNRDISEHLSCYFTVTT